MTKFVIDASATLAWLFGENAHRAKLPKSMAEARLVAPWLWRTEVTNKCRPDLTTYNPSTKVVKAKLFLPCSTLQPLNISLPFMFWIPAQIN